MSKVLVVATSRKTRGGITSVVKAHETGEQWRKYHCQWIETHRGGYKWRKIIYFITGFVQYLFFAPCCDLVHMHVSYAGSLKRGCAIMRIAKMFNKKTIVHFHPPGPEVLQDIRNHKRYNYLFDHADVVLVLSEQWRKWIFDILGPKNNIEILYNPCPKVNRIVDVRKKKQILLAGFVVLRKGYDTMLKAFARIAERFPEWHIAFAGIGDIDKGERLAEQLGISNQVNFLGWVGGADKERLFNESSIYCLASTGEGFPMAILDAWSYGLPCIMTPVGGIPDIVRDGVDGLIFPVGDDKRLSLQLERLICDKQLRATIVSNTDKYAEGLFNIGNINKQLENIYDRLIN